MQYGYFVEYGRDQTDEEDDLPSGQHTMCTYNNMWTSRGSTQAKPEAGVKILQPIFSGNHLTPTRHLLAEEIKHSMIMSTPATMGRSNEAEAVCYKCQGINL